MPRIEPMIVPRTMATDESIKSFFVGSRPLIFDCTMSRLSFDTSRLRMISAKPNTPMATLAKPMPSESSGQSKVMRPAPVSMSEPTIDIRRPARIMAIALSTEPCASTTANIRPSTISEKYSAGPNHSAILVSGSPSAATRQKPILAGCAATEKPSARFWNRSNMRPASGQEGRPQRERQFENPGEQHDAAQRHDRRRNQALPPAHLARAGDRDDEGGEGGRDAPHRRQQPAAQSVRECSCAMGLVTSSAWFRMNSTSPLASSSGMFVGFQ